MSASLFPLLRPLLKTLDPETAHHLTIRALKLMPVKPCQKEGDPSLSVQAFGFDFPSPVGLAAGFDKKGEVIDQLLALGFGFVEAGGVTPLPQEGNPRPRVFRLYKDEAVINRYGLNSDGLEAMRARLEMRKDRGGIVGINLGANKDSSDRIADYVRSVKALAGLADFLTLNISSPNTPGLRDLQGEAFLGELLARSKEALLKTGTSTKLLLKIAPDIDELFLDTIVETALSHQVDGLIISNTTIARPQSLKETELAKETGGLSGKPLFAPSTRLLAKAYLKVGKSLPLIGVGGIDSGQAAWDKICAGATLIQLYTGLVYHGPALITQIRKELAERLKQSGKASLQEVTGCEAAIWAAKG